LTALVVILRVITTISQGAIEQLWGITNIRAINAITVTSKLYQAVNSGKISAHGFVLPYYYYYYIIFVMKFIIFLSSDPLAENYFTNVAYM
jgi:hypothetical protein